MRRYKSGVGAVGALGKAFYKGGFEPRMNRREAALILQLRSVLSTTLVRLRLGVPDRCRLTISFTVVANEISRKIRSGRIIGS